METPITEHPDFKLVMEEQYNYPNLTKEEEILIGQSKIDYQLGTKTAQSILDREHEKEIEEFEAWYRRCVDYDPHISNEIKYVVLTNPNQYVKKFAELLELFRKERGNE